jgi:hypothetical protein
MTVPYAFANLSGNIALAKLDSNFNTPITIGNTSVLLGNTVSTLTNLTLGNVTITSGNIFTIPATSGGTGLVSPGSTGNVLTSNGTAWVSTGVSVGSGVTAISFGSTGLTPSTSTSGNVTVSGTLSANSGGTGLSSLTANSVLLGNGTGSIVTVSPGNAGNVLTSVGGFWVSNAAVMTSVGGSPSQVQYNNAGAFGGISGFTTDGTRVTASTTMGVGGATPSTSGSGITFPATQSPSTDVNTLDDYEEGTWTPTDASGAGLTLVVTIANYTKVGRIVTAHCQITYPTTASGASAIIGGLPFTSAIFSPAAASGSAGIFLILRTVGGSTTASVLNAATNAAITNSQLSTFFIICTIVYTV